MLDGCAGEDGRGFRMPNVELVFREHVKPSSVGR